MKITLYVEKDPYGQDSVITTIEAYGKKIESSLRLRPEELYTESYFDIMWDRLGRQLKQRLKELKGDQLER